jgi:hypothetical protein
MSSSGALARSPLYTDLQDAFDATLLAIQRIPGSRRLSTISGLGGFDLRLYILSYLLDGASKKKGVYYDASFLILEKFMRHL